MLAQRRRVRLRHIEEARKERRFIGCGKRVSAQQVDVVFDEHEVTHAKVDVDAAGCVRDHELVRAERMHQDDGKRNLLGRVSLVGVQSPLHADDRSLSQRSDDETTCMQGSG